MTATRGLRITYISWAPHCSRSDATARELGGTSHMVYWGWLGSHPATVWLKYIGQALSTWAVLLHERPQVVFVMSPPPIAVLPVYGYCAVLGGVFVVDAHSGVFLTRRWRWFQRLHFWLCRRAATTIVTNEYLSDLLQRHGARATVVADVPVVFETQGESRTGNEEFTVVCVTSFDRDEPIEVMVEAARRLPQLRFLMTGAPPRRARYFDAPLPPNLQLTGFLDPAAYGRLLRRAGVVVALTTDDHTMQRAAYEAIYQGTPVIVSDTALLRDAFDDGAVHVANEPDALVSAVLKICAHQAEYKEGALRLRARKIARWARTKAGLLDAIAGSEIPARSA